MSSWVKWWIAFIISLIFTVLLFRWAKDGEGGLFAGVFGNLGFVVFILCAVITFFGAIISSVRSLIECVRYGKREKHVKHRKHRKSSYDYSDSSWDRWDAENTPWDY